MTGRWWTYQRERFPLAAYGLLAVVASFAALSYPALLAGRPMLPAGTQLLAASISALAFFVQMRVADEFKDRDDDARWRPYRPVPRGLVKLRELAAIAGASAVLQVALALAVSPRLLATLALAWAYFGLMSMEFFAGPWLKARPLAYLLSHLPMAGLIVLHLSAFAWLPATTAPPAGAGLLIAIGVTATAVLELGRKLRAPADEEPGVLTYSKAWGRRRGTFAWLAAVILLGQLAGAGAASLGHLGATADMAMATFPAGAAIIAAGFILRPSRRKATAIDIYSRTGALLAYLAVSPLSLLVLLL
jgi:4-hydroxybenzoate polyprenyltransferase